MTDNPNGKVITSRGPVEPEALGRVLMHEHLHCDMYDWLREELIAEEKPITPARRAYLMEEAVPFLKKCTEHACFGFLDATMPPWRAWPTFYPEASEASGMHIILCTGFYREVELGAYWAKRPEEQIWPFVREASVDELAEFCTKEILEGIHGTDVRAGAIKLGTSAPEMTEAEEKAFRAGARAQKATGGHITTHCTKIGAETTQLRLLADEGVDLNRVAIGHTAGHLADPQCREVCMEWMKQGANFLPTNLGITSDDPPGERWRPLVEAIHEVFDAGLGKHVVGFGLDWAFVSQRRPFGPCSFIAPPPWLHMFTRTLPAFRALGLSSAEEEAIMRTNSQRILPVRR